MAERKPKHNRIPGVFKRGEKWTFKVSFTDAKGRYRQQWRGGFDTQDLAAAARRETQTSLANGIDIDPAKVTVAQYVQRWLKDNAGRLGPKTHVGYAALVRNHVDPVIGQVLLSKLRPIQLESVYTAMRDKGLSEKTVLNCHRALSVILKKATRLDLISRNPLEKVDAPRPRQYRPEVMPIGLVRELVRMLNDTPHHVLIHFAVYSGMRQGELLRLRWKHVDFGTGVVSIPTAKTRAGERAIALSADAVELLRQHRYRQMGERREVGPAYKDDGQVFALGDGRALTPMMVDWAWQKLRTKLGTTARFHDVRHTNASLLLAAGVPMKVVQERLGHSSYQITADTYSHLIPGLELGEKAAARLDQLLREGPDEPATGSLGSFFGARQEESGQG